MTDVVQNVQTNFVLQDRVTAPLRAMHGAASRVSSLFNHASEIIGMFGTAAGVAGAAFSAHHMITGTQKFLGTVKQLKDFTGLTAESAGGMLSAFKEGGIEADEATRSMMMMSKAAARMEMTIEGSTHPLRGNAEMFRRMGVDINRGPQAAMMKMAELAQRGKLRAQDLMLLFRMQGESARKMVNVLKKGPEHLHESIEEMKRLGISTESNVAMQARIAASQNRIKELWEKIQLVVGVQLLPIIEKLMKSVEGQLHGWLEGAKSFGTMLGHFLDQHLGTVMKISKIMLLNFTLMKATGTGLGGWASKLGGFVGKAAGLGGVGLGPAARRGSAKGIAGDIVAGFQLIPDYIKHAKNQTLGLARGFVGGVKSGIGAFVGFFKPSNIFGIFRRMFAGGGGGIAGIFRGMLTPLVSLGQVFLQLRPVIAMLLRLTLVGAIIGLIIGLVVEAVQLVQNNVDGIRTWLTELWGTLKARFAVIIDMLHPIVEWFSSSGAMGKFLHEFAFGLIVMLGEAVDGMMHMLQTIVYVMANWKDALMHPLDTFAKGWEETARMTAEKQRVLGIEAAQEAADAAVKAKKQKEEEASAARESPMQMNFPNARFDIKQQFAEGFDPDRIAVAFTNDLATLGERALQSGFSPIGAVR